MILLDEESKRENFQEVSLTAQELTFRYKERKRADKKEGNVRGHSSKLE